MGALYWNGLKNEVSYDVSCGDMAQQIHYYKNISSFEVTK